MQAALEIAFAILTLSGHLPTTQSRNQSQRQHCEAVRIKLHLSWRPLTNASMLYEFYTKQNVKKPRSVHATYLITGRKPTSEHTNGVNGSGLDKSGDSYMQSSPPMSSMPETEASDRPVPKTTIVLVREEELESMFSWGRRQLLFTNQAGQRQGKISRRLHQNTSIAWSLVQSRYRAGSVWKRTSADHHRT
jgi:hypothetical protein